MKEKNNKRIVIIGIILVVSIIVGFFAKKVIDSNKSDANTNKIEDKKSSEAEEGKYKIIENNNSYVVESDELDDFRIINISIKGNDLYITYNRPGNILSSLPESETILKYDLINKKLTVVSENQPIVNDNSEYGVFNSDKTKEAIATEEGISIKDLNTGEQELVFSNGDGKYYFPAEFSFDDKYLMLNISENQHELSTSNYNSVVLDENYKVVRELKSCPDKYCLDGFYSFLDNSDYVLLHQDNVRCIYDFINDKEILMVDNILNSINKDNYLIYLTKENIDEETLSEPIPGSIKVFDYNSMTNYSIESSNTFIIGGFVHDNKLIYYDNKYIIYIKEMVKDS